MEYAETLTTWEHICPYTGGSFTTWTHHCDLCGVRRPEQPNKTDALLQELSAVLAKHEVTLNAELIGFSKDIAAIVVRSPTDPRYYFKTPCIPLDRATH